MHAERNLALRDEYLEDRLGKAADIVWIHYAAAFGFAPDEEPTDEAKAEIVERCRLFLEGRGLEPCDPDVPDEIYQKALEIMNLPRSYRATSAAPERR